METKKGFSEKQQQESWLGRPRLWESEEGDLGVRLTGPACEELPLPMAPQVASLWGPLEWGMEGRQWRGGSPGVQWWALCLEGLFLPHRLESEGRPWRFQENSPQLSRWLFRAVVARKAQCQGLG